MSTYSGAGLGVEPSDPEPVPDDADEFLARVQKDPVARGSFEDAEMRAQLVSRLTATRLRLTLTQHQVADAMETTQSTVSDFENGRMEIRLSALQRYARAVGSDLTFSLAGVATPTDRPADPSGEPDDLDSLLVVVATNAEAQVSFRDAERRADLVATMVTLRQTLGISQGEVAEAIESTQSSVSDLENGRTDARFSVVQRYARAVGSKIEAILDGMYVDIEDPAFVAEGRRMAASAGFEDLFRTMLRSQTRLTRRHLIGESRLSRAAADVTLQRLTRSGFVTLEEPSHGGTEVSVQINESATCFIGISIRRDHVKGIRTNGSRGGDDASVSRVDIGNTDPETVLGAITNLVQILSEDSKYSITALGAELSGPVNSDTGTVLFAPDLQPHTNASWTSFPLGDEIQNRTGILTVVSNDANAMATYEHLRRGSPDGLIVVNIAESNSGIGAGLFFNGRLIRGLNGRSGELGHMIIRRSGVICTRCGGDRCGCLEAEASVEAILNKSGVDTADEASARAEAGDPRVNRAFSKAGRQLGDVLGDLSTILNPGRLVIYGAPFLLEDGRRSSRSYTSGVIKGLRENGFKKVQEPEFVVAKASTGPVAAAVTAFDWLLARPENWARTATLDPLATLVAPAARDIPEHSRVFSAR